LGYRGDDLLSFKLKLNNPSKIAELQELESWEKKFSVASTATEGFVSRRWIAHHLFNMTDEEFVRNEEEMFYDAKFNAALEAAGEAPEGGEGGGMDLGGDEDLDLGGDEELDLGDEEGEEEGGALLVEPGDEELTEADEDTVHYTFPDGTTTTNKSKGKNYKPKKKWEDGRQAGARTRSTGAVTKPFSYSRGDPTGKRGLDKLAKGYVFAENKTIYEDMESSILNSNREIEKLIESLEKINETKTQQEA